MPFTPLCNHARRFPVASDPKLTPVPVDLPTTQTAYLWAVQYHSNGDVFFSVWRTMDEAIRYQPRLINNKDGKRRLFTVEVPFADLEVFP